MHTLVQMSWPGMLWRGDALGGLPTRFALRAGLALA